jgi:hypothetical protein
MTPSALFNTKFSFERKVLDRNTRELLNEHRWELLQSVKLSMTATQIIKFSGEIGQEKKSKGFSDAYVLAGGMRTPLADKNAPSAR